MSCRQMFLHTLLYLPVLCLVALVAINVQIDTLPPPPSLLADTQSSA